MITSKFFKYYVAFYFCLLYLFVGYYTNIITWETPSHLRILMSIILSLGTCFFAAMVLSCMAEDMMAAKESFSIFGKKKLFRIWQYLAAPIFIWEIYKWEHFGIIIPSLLMYMGMKALITNHNNHVEAFNEEELKRKARQEQAEQVTL
ncbi:hypothetical protein SEPL_488 [Salmonella phage SE_PL]|nr:hypothetical protein [Salmonella enterica]ELL7856330.1 hypothetical protein [Salmonella enterica]QCW18584.1 hypothetical protein 7t3_063 [Salmonella phage 7t3]QIG63101.1 hypothetical protein SEPL_488 [Salmonella phage SE_PL]WNV47563.1 hypothetical protein [Klebsiella phage fENko-Kae01]